MFETADGPLLNRAWLLDPVDTQVAASSTSGRTSEREHWNGEFCASFGHDASRSWDEAAAHGFISAGGGSWHSGTLNLLTPGDRLWVMLRGMGFVGVGRVRKAPCALPSLSYTVPTERRVSRSKCSRKGHHHRDFVDDPDKSEYFVAAEWAQAVPLGRAVNEVGLLGNQNSVCAPRTPKWRHTVERLKIAFAQYDVVGS